MKQERGEGGNYQSPPFITVLGIAQDGGVPHSGCAGECCKKAWTKASSQRRSTCLGIIDPISQERWMIDATPDFRFQLKLLQDQCHFVVKKPLDGIWLTHGHIGHYTGLLHLEKAVMNSKHVPVFAMPKMFQLLSENLPWRGLISNHNILINLIQDHVKYPLNDRVSILPFLVPHRDEFTETVGFQIAGPTKKVLFIPDIDRWEQFGKIDSLVENSDVVMVDGTFFSGRELENRDMSQVPHPSIEDSLQRFKNIPIEKKSQFFFIHLNHTNPCLDPKSREFKQVTSSGFHIAQEGQIVPLTRGDVSCGSPVVMRKQGNGYNQETEY